MILAISFEDGYGEFVSELQEVFINLDTMTITGNEDGMNVWSKVVDTGMYMLFDEDMNAMYEIAGDYVPNCVPNEYGDYIDIEVQNGKVTNWEATQETVLAEFEEKGRFVG